MAKTRLIILLCVRRGYTLRAAGKRVDMSPEGVRKVLSRAGYRRKTGRNGWSK